MKREIGVEIELEKTVIVKTIGTSEEIVSVNHRINEKKLEVFTQIYNSEGETLKNDYLLIEGEKYDSIIIEGQPLPSEDSLWSIIDEYQQPSS